jgi:predicted Zn finger-like uncharacterized protein
MIIKCYKCRTSYRIDDAKIKATGTKLRCSRCMHEFTVSRPPMDNQEQLTRGIFSGRKIFREACEFRQAVFERMREV